MRISCRAQRPARWCAAASLAAALALSNARYGQAYDDSTFREIETKYIFGFTEGSSIGLQGEKEVSLETVAALGKRDGRFFATQTKLEFEHTPSQFVQIEFGALASSHDIENVTGLDDRHAVSFGGLFGELRYLLVERGAPHRRDERRARHEFRIRDARACRHRARRQPGVSRLQRHV